MVKLEFKEDRTLGVFGENIESENYVLINEEIKSYILTKSVRLKQESCIVGKVVGEGDFEEYILENTEEIIEPGINEFMLETDFRLSKLELGV